MTKVNCPTSKCDNNQDGVCGLGEIHRVVSVNRDYDEQDLCREDTTR